MPDGLETPRVRASTFRYHWIAEQDDAELRIGLAGAFFRVHGLGDLHGKRVCAVVPLDALFDVRLTAARRLWRALNGRNPGADPAALSQAQRTRLVHALRALDARRDDATYREIAAALFGTKRLPERGWKTHDLRDRTIRLYHLGFDLAHGGYRQLLLYPFRKRLF